MTRELKSAAPERVEGQTTQMRDEPGNPEPGVADAAPPSALQGMAVKVSPRGGARPPISILDQRFVYVPASHTNVAKTFERVRARMK